MVQITTENLIKSRSDVILTGHTHSLRAYVDLTASLIGRINTRSHPIICGARCVYDENRNPTIVPGYSIINIVFDNDQIQKIYMYEVSYDKNRMEWLRDPNNPVSPLIFGGNGLSLPEQKTQEADNSIPKLQIGDMSTVKKWGWDSTKLAQELVKLDYEVIEGLKPDDEGEVPHWARIFVNHPDTWRILYNSPGEIVGYWSYVPLFPDNFDMLKNGKIVEGQVTDDMIPTMDILGHVKIFFSMLALRENYRGTSAIHLLYYSFLDVVQYLAQHRIFFDEIATNAYSPAGEAICKSFEMKYIRDSPINGKIYARAFYPFPRSNAFLEHPTLLSLYKEEYEK